MGRLGLPASPARWGWAVVLAASAACARGEGPRPAAMGAGASAARWAREVGAALEARDAGRVAALYAPAATLVVVGEREARGRGAIAAGVAALLDAVEDVRIATGRTWLGDGVAVVELQARGRRRGRELGVIAAAVARFDRDGLVTEQRIHVDVATLLAQEGTLPDGPPAPLPVRSLPDGAGVRESRDTAEEARNLEVSSQIWAALGAHDAEAALRRMTADYVLDDIAAPAPLGRDATRAMVARFVAAVPDFAIASLPVHFAAGTDVVTEMVERGTLDGRPVTLHGLDVRRYRGGQVIAEWQYTNAAELIRHLRGVELAWPPPG